jgi:hypothetical protein
MQIVQNPSNIYQTGANKKLGERFVRKGSSVQVLSTIQFGAKFEDAH